MSELRRKYSLLRLGLLGYLERLIRACFSNHLVDTAGPADLYAANLGCIAETKVQSERVL